MAYYSEQVLEKMGFKFLGANVQISDKASIYNCDEIEIGDNSRIDDFCVVSGKVMVGKNVHITSMCLIAGGEYGIIIDDFCALAYGVKVFTQSDDYSGRTMTNSTIPKKYKAEKKESVIIKKYCIVGAGSVIMPGVVLEEGVSVGAMTLVLVSTEPWSIYVGIPARKLKDRRKDILKKTEEFINEHDSI